MAILTKAQLEALNQSSFPDQSTEAITPAILRNYNTQTIDTLVDSLDTGSFTTDAEFNAFTSSTNSSITQLNASSASQQVSINALNGATSSYATSAITASSLITASVNLNTITFTKGNGTTFDVTVNTGSGGGTTDITSLNAFTSSQLNINSGLNASTASQQISIDNLNSTTASINSSITQLNASSASQQISINALNTNSGSVNSSITQLNASSASQQISIDALNTTSASLNTSASLALTTASFSGNTLTFTKGNGTTFGVVIPDVSGSAGNFVTTSSFNAYTASTDSSISQLNASSASQQISIDALSAATASYVTSAITASSLVTASVAVNVLTFTKGDGTQFNLTVASSGSVTPGTISGSAQITALGFVSSSVTASSLITASLSGQTITFTKGDSSTFGIVLPSGSVPTDITALNAFTASQLTINTGYNTFTQSAQAEIDSLQAATASYAISSSVAAVDAAQQSQINSLIAATGSYITTPLTSLNSFTSSQETKDITLASVTSSLNSATASLFASASLGLTTASFSGNTLTFTKGDASTFGVVIPDVSGSTINTGSFVTTSSFNAYTASVTESVVTAIVTNNGSNYYLIDGIQAPKLSFVPGPKYRFDLSGIAGNHPFKFSTTPNGPTEYTTGVTSGSNFIQIEVGYNTTTPLYYYCTNHSGMGNEINVLGIEKLLTTASFNAYTASTNSSITQLNASTASQQSEINSLIAATSSYATSAITASSLVTASFSGNTLTFTKGNGTTFGVVIPDVSGSTINTGSFATTGSNAFFGTNSFSGAVSFTGSAPSILSSSFSGSLITNLTDVYTDVAAVQQIVTLTSASYAALLSGSLTNPNTLYIVSGSTSGSGGTTDITALNAFTASQEILNTTFATTGSNTFIGTQNINNGEALIFRNAGLVDYGFIGLRNTSGSLDIVSLGTGKKVDLQSLSLLVSGTFTASLQEGYVWVGDSTGKTVTVATSSFGSTINTGSFVATSSFNDYTSSNNQRVSSLEANSASVNTSITNINSATASLFTSASLGLVTASFASQTLTFTKGDGTTFGIVIPDVSGSTLPSGLLSSSVTNFTDYSTSVDSRLDGLEAATSSYVTSAITASLLLTASASPTANTITFTKGDSTTFDVVLNITASASASFDTGSFATTGSNTFIGNETFSNTDGNGTTLTPFSGSLVFTPKAGFASSSSLQNHLFISASATGQTSITNIIFNTSAQSSPTGSVIVSGSQNIFNVPTTNTAGFVRRLTAGNLSLGAGVLPQFTSSMNDVPVTYSNNIHGNGSPIFRGPISSSTYTFTGNVMAAAPTFGDATESMVSASAGISFSGNFIVAAPTFRAGRTQLVASVNASNNLFGGAGFTSNLASSSVTYNQNSFYGTGGNLQNNYFAPSASNNNQRVEFLYNLVGGQSSQFYASGSNTTTTYNRQINNNFMGGNFCQVSASANGDNSSLLGTIIYGNNIITYANSPYSSGVYGLGYGSAFLGRNNDLSGTKALTADTIFAVGTGTGFGTRKTGFLIDSGSNTFVEGTLNVSGSTSFNGAVNITGSLTSSLTQGYVWVGGAGNVSTLVATSSFAGGVTSAITASSLVTASVNLNTITFTKGDASTFAITVDTGSGGGSVPAGTVSSSAQILGYNIFATTGSNTFTNYQVIKSNLTFEEPIAGEGSDNSIRMNSLNQSTLYVSNTSISSGYNSGSILQLTTATGSNGYGFSGSATFQMDANYGGKTAKMQVANINGVGTAVYGFAERVEFAKAGGFPNTPADVFRVDAASIELSGSIKVNTGSSGSAAIVSVANGATVYNGLVNSNSIILLTTQNGVISNVEYPAVVNNKQNGSFEIHHNAGSDLNVAYLIINPI
jgi:hypothetical protein